MSKINRHPVRRTAAGVLASALVLSGAVAAAVPAQAAAGFELTRVAGDDRYKTSALTVAAFGQATGAILASGENGRTPDALAASFLAGIRNQPVALTTRNRVTAEVLAALNGLGGKNITVVGGTAAVSDDVVAQLRAAGFTVDRVFGANRYETAREIVEAGESPAASNVGIVASGTSTIDALAGGALSFAGKHPMFLVTRDGIPGATLEAMRTSGVTSVYILGGEAVVGPRVVAQLTAAGVSVRERLAGDNRSETSVAIANELIAEHNFTPTTFNLASGLNEGVDALGGAALSGKERRVLLVTQNASTAPAVTGFATTNTARLTAAGRVFGGPAAVSTTFEAAVEAAGVGTVTGPIALASATVVQGAALTGTITGDFSAVTVSGCGFTNQAIGADSDAATAGRQFSLTVPAAQAAGACTLTFTATPTAGGAAVTQTVTVTVTAPTAGNNQTITVTPTDRVLRTLVGADEEPDTADDRQYSVTGLDNARTYNVALVASADVTVSAAGQVSFEDDPDNDVADLGGTGAVITVVNGAPTEEGADTAEVSPVNGTITFTVDFNGEGTASVRPVVWVDAETTDDDSLDLNDNDTPSEAFGIGGVTAWVPGEAALGFASADGAEAAEIDTEANSIVVDDDADGTADVSVFYDANDTFAYTSGLASPVSITAAQFEQFLSEGDAIVVTGYQPTEAGQSTFAIVNDIPAAPTALAATVVEGDDDDVVNDVNLTWTAPANLDVVDYEVQQAPVSAAGVVGTFVDVVDADENDENTRATVADLAPGTYAFRVVAENEAEDRSPASNVVRATVAAGADRTAPVVDSINVEDGQASGTGFGTVGAGDTIALTLSERVALTANASLTFQDADGTVATLVRGGNATFTQNANGRTLFITVTGAPTVEEPGATPGAAALTLAAADTVEVVDSAGVADAAGNELAELTAGVEANSAADRVVVTFNTSVDPDSVTVADLTVPGRAVTAVAADATNRVFTFTVTNLTAGDIATLRANAATGEFGGNGPAGASVSTGAVG